MRWVSIGLVLLTAALPAHGANPRTIVDELAKPFLEGKKNVGLVIGIISPEGRWVGGYGVVPNGPDKVVPNGDTIFELGSVTKAYTGILLALLDQDGTVKLDDPANKYLPKELWLPRRGERAISLLDLSTHHSGLPVQPPNIGWRALMALPTDWSNPYRHYDLKKLAYDMTDIWPESDAGEKYAYSNLGAGILGHALAFAAKDSSYEDLLIKRVLAPLGLSDTRITLTEAQRRRFPPGFNKMGGETSHWDFASLEACGGLRSTVHDQLKFLAALLGLESSPLKSAFESADQPRRPTDTKRWHIGLGWHMGPLKSSGGPTVIWHNGGTYGARSFVGYVPAKKIGVVVLNNTGHSVDELALKLLTRLVNP